MAIFTTELASHWPYRAALPARRFHDVADPVVFGDWLPGPQPPRTDLACKCGCGQRDPGRCWNCGATMPWQWND
jgi:hypothetical protein